MKKAEALVLAINDRRGVMVQVEDIRSHEKRELKLLGAIGALIELEWRSGGGGSHPADFSRNSGCGRGEMRHWKITEAGREALGLPAFGKETAFYRHWRNSLAMAWGRAGS